MNKFLSISLLTSSLSCSAFAGLEVGLDFATSINVSHIKYTTEQSTEFGHIISADRHPTLLTNPTSKQFFPYGASLGYSTAINGDPLRLKLTYTMINVPENFDIIVHGNTLSSPNPGHFISETFTLKTLDQVSLFAYFLSPINSQFNYTIGVGPVYRRTQGNLTYYLSYLDNGTQYSESGKRRVGDPRIWGVAVDAGIERRFGQHLIISPTVRYTQFGRGQLSYQFDEEESVIIHTIKQRPKEFEMGISLIYTL